MQTISLPYRQSKVELLKFGQGKELLILIHGFGDSAQLFRPFVPAFEEQYTAYAISLPYHGETDWKPGFFDKQDLINIINTLCEQEGKERFTLLGYSLGGKISLSLVEPFADRLGKLLLFGPDGIKTHKLYDVTNLHPAFLASAKLLMRVPTLFFAVARLMHRRGILSKFLYDFTLNHFSTERQRRRFFCISRSVYFFVSDLRKVKTILNQHQIPVRLFYGKRDEVIILKGAFEFQEGLNDCQLYQLDKGHLMIDEEVCEFLKGLRDKELISIK